MMRANLQLRPEDPGPPPESALLLSPAPENAPRTACNLHGYGLPTGIWRYHDRQGRLLACRARCLSVFGTVRMVSWPGTGRRCPGQSRFMASRPSQERPVHSRSLLRG